MANLTVTAADVAPVRLENAFTGPAAEAITAGQFVRLDTTTGYVAIGNASSAGEVGSTWGIALRSVAAGQAVTVAGKDSILDMGDALDALDYDAAVYLSNTDGTLADAAGTVSTVVGNVFPIFSHEDGPDKLLKLVS